VEKFSEFYKMILAELRKALGEARITQIQIGEALGIKQSAVSSLLSGKSRLSLEQFLVLAELVGVRPPNLLQSVQNRMTQVVPMSAEVERTLYKSEVHLLSYCAATREILPSEVRVDGYSAAQVHKAMDELCDVGLLVKKKNRYVQKDPQTSYRAATRLTGSRVHQTIVRRSWDLFDRRYTDRAFIATKFNVYMLDRFSVTQTKEIEAALWTVYEKVQSFRQANLSNGYTDDAHMPLWNVHLMLMTPFEPEN
jgi:transcriptional regulator with XRE-family HTH domain